MATNSQLQETSEYHAFRKHYAKLAEAIQHPLSLANQLFSEKVITSEVKERMHVPLLSRLDKNSQLLNAVEIRIKTDPSVFPVLLSILRDDASLQPLVESMQSKYLCATLLYGTRQHPVVKLSIWYQAMHARGKHSRHSGRGQTNIYTNSLPANLSDTNVAVAVWAQLAVGCHCWSR